MNNKPDSQNVDIVAAILTNAFMQRQLKDVSPVTASNDSYLETFAKESLKVFEAVKKQLK